MPKKELQIVSFNNPNPPDYGGAIDVYYKIKALSELGVDILLHSFYDDRKDILPLKPFCKQITLYKRKKGIFKYLSIVPYSVNTRISNHLIENLNASDAPVLFESIITTGVLLKQDFKQKLAVRCHNIEHQYSRGLFKSERNLLKKIAFYIESLKLERYESILKKADVLFPLSYFEFNYFKKRFSNDTLFLPVFQNGKTPKDISGFGKYALYHGDLSISDNIKSALFLVEVFKELNVPLIIASSTNNRLLTGVVSKYENISFQLIRNEGYLNQLISGAHINTLYSFQRSGTKLKVFNALFNGRHCIVNENMVDDSNVLAICVVAETVIEYQDAVKRLFETEYKLSSERVNALKIYDVELNAQKLVEAMF